ncbi:MAG: cell division protein FtsX [Bacteroidia bacterium]
MSSFNTSKPRISKRDPSSWPPVVSIAIILYLLGLSGLMFFAGQKLVDSLKEKIYVNVYFSQSTDEKIILEALATLKSKLYTKEAFYLSSEDAAFAYKKELEQDFVDILGYNPLPASIELSVKAKYSDRASLRNIEKELYLFEGVTEVLTQTNLVEDINKNKKMASGILAGIGLLFIIIAFFLINSTIRLSIYSKRFLIRSMQLVGATEGFIIKPFLKKAIFQAFVGFVISSVLLSITFYIMGNWANELLFSGQMKWIDTQNPMEEILIYSSLFACLFLIGMLIATICTYWSTKRYLYSNIEDLY